MDLLSIVSAAISVLAAMISILSLKHQQRSSQLGVNISFLTESMKLLAQHPELLALHNIELDKLKRDNFTLEEFIYILNTIYAGQAYYAVNGQSRVKLSEYRRNLLQNAKFKTAWTIYIRDKMTMATPFTKAIDKYYKSHV